MLRGDPEVRRLVEIARAELPRRTRAYESLVALIYPDLHRIALGVVGNADAADQATQDSLLRVLHKLHTLETPDAFAAWVSRIVVNTARSQLTKERREREKADRAAVYMPDAEGVAAAGDKMPSFADLIAPLTEVERTILALRFQQDLELNEISNITGLGLSATKMRLYRAMEKLRAARNTDGVT